MTLNWPAKKPKEVLDILSSSEHGLTSAEAARRLKENGPNKLPEAKTENIFVIFLRQFQDPLIYILILASLAIFLLGQAVDASVIFLVLVLNALIGAVQEGRAKNTLLALKKFVNTKATVIRDGRELRIPDSQVVVGDILVIRGGDKIAADGRIIESKNLKINEAALTGESKAVSKFSDFLEGSDIPLTEQKNMLFKGTAALTGSCRAAVTSIGKDTAIGSIAANISEIKTDIPLKTNIKHLSHVIIGITSLMSIAIFARGIYTDKTAVEMFSTAVAVSVSVIPEGLPIAITLILATGVWRMSKQNILVKRLQAVEALGHASVIAVDKTGTITKNEMVIQEIYTDGDLFEIGGIGYEPSGKVSLAGSDINPPDYPSLLFAGKIASLCANARTTYDDSTKIWQVSGDPTEAAMFVLGEKLGFDKDLLEKKMPAAGEIPFDYKLKYHLMVHENSEEKLMTVVGAPEVVLKLCDKVWHQSGDKPFSAEDLERLNDKLIEISEKGLRVLAFAVSTEIPGVLKEENIKSLTFVGFYGMKDALREDVEKTVKRAENAGIKIVMITGDYETTAKAIAKEATIYKDGDDVLSGIDIDNMSDKSLQEALPKTSVFARVTPTHKLRIINAFKACGETIAMTGDGVNDAPSLTAADLGVAMGRIGTEVAKESSDIILLDDDFGSIISGIEEGRTIYKSIKKVVLYLLSTGLGEMMVIAGAIFMSLPLPLLPAQIIWLNFVTDTFFTAALAMEPKEKGLLSEKTFRKPSKYIADTDILKRMLLMALPMIIGTLVLFEEYAPTDLSKAWTVSLTLLAVFQWFNAWNCRSENKSVFNTNPLSNKFLVWATLTSIFFQLLAVYHPLFQKFLRTVPLNLSDWLVIISFASSVILVEEIRKFAVRLKKNKREQKVLMPAEA